jgi:hypothetical protein
MSLLTGRRDNDKVVIEIETDLANECDGSVTATVPFEWKMSQVYSADLLMRYIENRIYHSIARARYESYNQGWKDAKAKNPKKNSVDWFSGNL